MPDNAPAADAGTLARRIIGQTGGDVRLALPLGLGKANSIVNALVRAACEDHSIRLGILTALTLQRPSGGLELERRFLEPAADRLFGRYAPLLYARMMEDGSLPANIEVHEFFFQAGRWLGNDYAQRHHVSANYTHALDYVLAFEPNVIAQLVARDDNGRISLSCNTDITVDLLAARRNGQADFLLAGEVNSQLPFMGGPAVLDEDELDMLLVHDDDPFELFSVVRRPVSLQETAIGLNVSRLVPDGGTIQIGIGSIGDAIAEALILRHRQPDDYRALLADNQAPAPGPESHDAPFSEGVYCVTEMLVGGLLELFEAGIIRREVDGAAIHAGFFLECRDFYRQLRTMPKARRDRIAMMPVSFTNSLYGGEAAKRAARKDARFVNNAMMVTCLGAAISDGIEDNRVVSGVGGQFNFVEQAFALQDGRSIITVNATRESEGETVSNIRWTYPNVTVPRHYRDIVVSEYGVADLRGKSDEACIAAMLAISDSRFQDRLLQQAKNAGKISRDHRIAPEHRNNTPERIDLWLGAARQRNIVKTFPFGTDFTATERRLLPALAILKEASASRLRLLRLAAKGLGTQQPGPAQAACLERLGLLSPSTLSERAYRLLVLGALAASGTGKGPEG